METRTFDLPCGQDPSGRRIWRLDPRGLEWTLANGTARWMPFACVRLATLGQTESGGWRLRLSGPPGAVVIEAGAENHPADIDGFRALSIAMIEGAANAGCGTKFRINHRTPRIDWIWARRGQLSTVTGLLDQLRKRSNAA